MVSYSAVNCWGELTHLFTEPQWRGRGLATRVTFAISRKMLEVGAIPIQRIAESNETALKVIEKSGIYVQSGIKYKSYRFYNLCDFEC